MNVVESVDVASEPGLLPLHHVRIPALDGVRGFAVILVMISHFFYYGGMTAKNTVERVLLEFAYAGGVGVDLFFVLSGFLITGILLDTLHNQRYFMTFFARRILRIFPLYYGLLFFWIYLLPRFFPDAWAFQGLQEDQLWYWSYLINVKIAIFGWPENLTLAHFWSLAVEEQFYLVWPLVVYKFQRRSLLGICAGILVASFSLRVGCALFDLTNSAYTLTPMRIDTLVIGSLIAIIGRTADGATLLRKMITPMLVLASVTLTTIVIYNRGFSSEDALVFTFGFTSIAVLFAGLLTWLIWAPDGALLKQFFLQSALRGFGQYSYGLYVYHHLIAILTPYYLFTVQDLPEILGSQVPAQIGYCLYGIGLSYAVAWLSWHLFEVHLLKLKEYFAYTPRL